MLGLSKSGLPKGAGPLKVAVLTARAQELKWALQLKDSDPVCRGFSDAGVAGGFDGWGIGLDRVMYGSVREWMLQDLKGWRKFENFKLLRAAYGPGGEPGAYVFVGDTGELDKEAGMRMLTDLDAQRRVRAVFPHVVSYGGTPRVPADSYINGRPIVYFRTYVGAAHKAVDHGLMAPAEAREVILGACKVLSRGLYGA